MQYLPSRSNIKVFTTLGNMLLMYKDFLSVQVVNIDLTYHILLLFIPPNIMSKQTIKDFEEILKLRQASKVRFFRRVCKKHKQSKGVTLVILIKQISVFQLKKRKYLSVWRCKSGRNYHNLLFNFGTEIIFYYCHLVRIY